MSFILTKNSGVPVKYLVEGYIENTSDLSNLGTNFTLGSKVYALDTGKAYVLSSNGSWEYLKEGGISPEDLDDYYTKEEVNDLIETQVDGRFVVADALPTENIQTNVIYLIPSGDPGVQNVRDEYINLTGTSAGWELIGSTQIDLSDYYTKTQADNRFVEKESGKGLSTNDYTTAEKEKLAGIATGAEVNVQSNWNESNASSDAYIQNKPTLGTAAIANVSDFATAAQGVKADNAIPKTGGQLTGQLTTTQTLFTENQQLVTKKYVDDNAGTSDYTDLTNKPSINDVMLSGNKTLTELGISSGSSIIDKLWENNTSAQPAAITLIHPYTDYDALLFVLGFRSEDDVNNIRSEFILSRDIAITQSPADNLLSFTNSYGDIGATMRAYFSSALQMNKYDELQTPAGSAWEWHSVIYCIYGIKFGGSDITIDTEMSGTSTNPVQNKVITETINHINWEGTQAQYEALIPEEKVYEMYNITADDDEEEPANTASLQSLSPLSLDRNALDDTFDTMDYEPMEEVSENADIDI